MTMDIEINTLADGHFVLRERCQLEEFKLKGMLLTGRPM